MCQLICHGAESQAGEAAGNVNGYFFVMIGTFMFLKKLGDKKCGPAVNRQGISSVFCP